MSTPVTSFGPGDIQKGQSTFDISITSADGSRTINIISIISQVNIYESIEREYVYAEITVVDALNIMQELPIVGDERVNLTVTSAGLDVDEASASYELYCFGHTPVGDFANRATTYTLRCISYEYLVNQTKTIDRSFNNTISSIVSDIAKNDLKTKKPFQKLTKTKGIVPYTAPRVTPFRAIRTLKEMAVSDDPTGGVFVFFENKNGYQFTTLEQLSKNCAQSAARNQYIRSTVLSTNAKGFSGARYQQILEYIHLTKFDSLLLSQQGAIKNQVLSFDVATNSVRKFDFNLKDKQGAVTHAGKDKLNINDSTYNRTSSADPLYMFVTRDSLRPDDSYYAMLGHKTAYTKLFFSNALRIKTYGDSYIAAGMGVNITLPPMRGYNGDDEVKDQDVKYSGNYVIVALMRTIISENGQFKYYDTFDCCKVGVGK